jgi:hypothetical protein
MFDTNRGTAAVIVRMSPSARRAVTSWSGDIRLSLRSTAQPRYTGLPILFSRCFPKVTIGFYPYLANDLRRGEVSDELLRALPRGGGGGGAETAV